MSRPRNWYDMSDDDRRRWQAQENEREEMEYAKEQAERAAERAARHAEDSRRELLAAREDAAQEQEYIREQLSDVQNERDELNVKLVMLRGRLQEHIRDLRFLWSNPPQDATHEKVLGILDSFEMILIDPS